MKNVSRIVCNLPLVIPALLFLSAPALAQPTGNWSNGTSNLLNNTGSFNSAFGVVALRDNTTGSHNTGIGRGALYKNRLGSSNTAVGVSALYNNSPDGTPDPELGILGNNNVAVGASALAQSTRGNDNVAVGASALNINVTGSENTAVGSAALFVNKSASNTAVGAAAAYYSLGKGTTALGAATYVGIDVSVDNTTAIGYTAMAMLSGATALGFDAQAMNGNATALGSSSRATGSQAIALGVGAQATGNYSTALGGNNPPGSYTRATAANALALGNGAQATASNSVALGSGAVVSTANAIRIGNTGITQIIGSATTVNLSDGRYKTNVRENVPGLEFITKLRPVTFKWQLNKLNKVDGVEEFATDAAFGEAREAKAKKVYTGFIAQDVEAAAQECGYDFSGVVKPENEESQYQLGYSEFVVPLVKAVQEQQKEIEELQKTVRALATDSRLPSGRLGAATAPAASQHAGVLGNFWGGAMTLLSAGLVLMHLKRRRESAPTR